MNIKSLLHNIFSLFSTGDVIIEVESLAVDDEHHHMIVDSLKNAGLSIRLVSKRSWSSVDVVNKKLPWLGSELHLKRILKERVKSGILP